MRRWLALPLLLVLLTACSGDAAEPTAAPSAAAPAPTAQPSEDTEPTEAPAAPSEEAAAPAAAGQVLGTREGQLGRGQVRTDVLSLRRSGDLVTVEISMTNLSPNTIIDPDSLAAQPGDTGVTGITLVEGTEGKRYLPAKDSAGSCVCSKADIALAPGGSTVLSASYAAPPEEVEVISVEVPGFGTFADVPISG